MTDQPLTNRAQLQQQLDDARAREASLTQALRLQVASTWEDDPKLRTLPVTAEFYTPHFIALQGNDGVAPSTVLAASEASRTAVPSPTAFYVQNGPNIDPVDATEAAARLGLERADMDVIAEHSSQVLAAGATLHQSLYEVGAYDIPQIEYSLEEDDELDLETQSDQDDAHQATGSTPELAATTEHLQQPVPAPDAEREWATDALDEPFTPARVAADWIQSTTMVKAYLEADRPDLARDWINELDANLRAFRDGEAAPGSDEAESVYHDAVARGAIPYGTSPLSPEEVRQQLAGLGEHVAPLDVRNIRESTGITPLDANYVTSKLDEATHLPTGLEDVAAARLDVRRAIASISEDSEAAQEYLQTANTRLGQVVEQLRPDQAHEGVLAAQESVQQASQKVAAVADTAAQVEAEVTVYSLPDCVGCAATKRALDKAGVEYDEIPLQEHPDLVARFKQQGLAQAPIVETPDGDRWSGYNPGKLKEHGLDHRTRQQRAGGHDRDTGQDR